MIALITYEVPHRKTQDLVSKLLIAGYTDLHLVAIPFVKRKAFRPLFQHRPHRVWDVGVEQMCAHLRLGYTRLELGELKAFFDAGGFEHILIAGAGLLPEELVERHKIINAHPGYLPNVRGLDALKWAIYLGQPIGVTTHYIDSKADEGLLIDRRIVPVYFEDTFHSLAYRVYETEIEMLVEAIDRIDSGEAPLTPLKDDRYEAHKRMPHRLELVMMARFEELRKRAPSREG